MLTYLLFFGFIIINVNSQYESFTTFIPRTSFAPIYVESINSVLIAGGIDENGNFLSSIEICVINSYYYFTDNTCILSNYSLSEPRGFLSGIYIKKFNLILFKGGYNNKENFEYEIDMINITSGNLTKIVSPYIINVFYYFYFLEYRNLVIFEGYNNYYYTLNIINYTWTNFTIPFDSSIISVLSNWNTIIYSGYYYKNYDNQLYLIVNRDNKTISKNISLDIAPYFLGSSTLDEEGISVIFTGNYLFIYNVSNDNLSIEKVINPNFMNPLSSLFPYGKKGLLFFGIWENGITKTIIYNINTKIWSGNYFIKDTLVYPSVFIPGYLLFIGGTIYGKIVNKIFALSLIEEGYTTFPYMFNKKKCDGGYYCPAGNIIPYNCGEGYYCPEGSYINIGCPAGTYNSNSFSSSSEDCISCPVGTFNIFFAQGSINNCLQCSPGFICSLTSPIPLPCPSNYYCPDPTKQIPCPIGTYFLGEYATNISSCKPCSPGTMCQGNGIGGQPCESGTYSIGYGNSECTICPPGNFCPYGSSIPQLCPTNFYSQKGSSGCTPCENDEFTIGPGKSTCISCPSSKFSFNGWWCMTHIEKVVFVLIWIGSIISGTFSTWKIYSFIKNRIIKMKEKGIIITVRNFIFFSSIKHGKRESLELIEISSQENDCSIGEESSLLESYRNEVYELKNIMTEMRTELSLIKNSK